MYAEDLHRAWLSNSTESPSSFSGTSEKAQRESREQVASRSRKREGWNNMSRDRPERWPELHSSGEHCSPVRRSDLTGGRSGQNDVAAKNGADSDHKYPPPMGTIGYNTGILRPTTNEEGRRRRDVAGGEPSLLPPPSSLVHLLYGLSQLTRFTGLCGTTAIMFKKCKIARIAQLHLG